MRNGYSDYVIVFLFPFTRMNLEIIGFVPEKRGENMIIQSGNVACNSNRTYQQRSSFRYGVMKMTSQEASYSQISDLMASREQVDNQGNPSMVAEQNQVGGITLQDRIEQLQQMRMQTFFYLLRSLFGERFESYAQNNYAMYGSAQSMAGGTSYVMETTRYYSEFTYMENETTGFNGTGTVVTADGRQLDFNIELTMSRSFTQTASEYIDFSQPVLCDPLVINLDTDVAAVSDQKFYFDLDCDGTEEEISTLETGNAFLALDHNQDGKINDGAELFGTKTGNGFTDLAAYDEDGNGWIDEADSVFEKLKVWVKDEDGNDKLYTLKEKGLGAIYLGSQSTDYTLRSASTGQVNGQIRQSGVFLYENGMAGTIAHVDMAVRAYENAM